MRALIHIVDDDPVHRTALGRQIRTFGYEIAIHESAKEFASRTLRQSKPSCILLECKMSEMNGLELQRCLIERGSILPIIFLTAHGDIPTAVQAIKAGAVDFLTKPASKSTLLPAISSALSMWRANPAKILTPTERIVLEHLHRGKIVKQSAFELGVSERTIKAHRRNIKDKLQVRSLAQLVSVAENWPSLFPGDSRSLVGTRAQQADANY